MIFAPTRSQLRLEQLINCGRPLTEPEQDELYRALHADYMRKWRAAKLDMETARLPDPPSDKVQNQKLLAKVRRELAA